jgi:hypothetical protein
VLATQTRRTFTRFLRRHRRPVAATIAGAGVLVALTSLRSAPATVVVASPPVSDLRPGEVAVPLTLASAALASTLATGDVIDVIGLSGADGSDPRAVVVARRSRVIDVPESSGTFGSSSSAIVLVAVVESAALNVSTAIARGPVTVVIRAQANSR